MKIAICDDEIEYLDIIANQIEKWAKSHNIQVTLYRFTNGDDLLLSHKTECMDLILLDIVMPLLNGIDTVRELRNDNQMIPVIFLTSSKEFAVESYDVKAFHYMLKPVVEEKLFAVLDDFLKTLKMPTEIFLAQTSMGFCKIVFSDVDYLEAQNKEVNVYLCNGTVIAIRELFSKCEDIFSLEKGFFKCHRSYIVNLNHVEQFTKTEIATNNNATIPISRNRYVEFKETYFNHMFQ